MNNGKDFNYALQMIKENRSVRRRGNKDRTISISYIRNSFAKAQGYSGGFKTTNELLSNGKDVDIKAYIMEYGNDGKKSIFVPTSDDMFSEDWEVVKDTE